MPSTARVDRDERREQQLVGHAHQPAGDLLGQSGERDHRRRCRRTAGIAAARLTPREHPRRTAPPCARPPVQTEREQQQDQVDGVEVERRDRVPLGAREVPYEIPQSEQYDQNREDRAALQPVAGPATLHLDRMLLPTSGRSSMPRSCAVLARAAVGARNQAMATPTAKTAAVATRLCQVKIVSVSGMTFSPPGPRR